MPGADRSGWVQEHRSLRTKLTGFLNSLHQSSGVELSTSADQRGQTVSQGSSFLPLPGDSTVSLETGGVSEVSALPAHFSLLALTGQAVFPQATGPAAPVLMPDTPAFRCNKHGGRLACGSRSHAHYSIFTVPHTAILTEEIKPQGL